MLLEGANSRALLLAMAREAKRNESFALRTFSVAVARKLTRKGGKISRSKLENGKLKAHADDDLFGHGDLQSEPRAPRSPRFGM